uniref:hypothetical protein n=1 Tax=Asticcacaulis benevestitus TaxID=347481 RepID=UPI000476CA80
SENLLSKFHYRAFCVYTASNGSPTNIRNEQGVLYRLVWFGTYSDAGSEANDGRGPVDFKISRGRDKTLVEMKLAKNTILLCASISRTNQRFRIFGFQIFKLCRISKSHSQIICENNLSIIMKT